MKNVILHDSIELNVNNNSQIISNKFNDFFINVKSDLLIKLRNQQNIIDNTNIITSSLLSIGIESIISSGTMNWGGAFDNATSHLEICQNPTIRIFLNKEQMYSTKN